MYKIYYVMYNIKFWVVPNRGIFVLTWFEIKSNFIKTKSSRSLHQIQILSDWVITPLGKTQVDLNALYVSINIALWISNLCLAFGLYSCPSFILFKLERTTHLKSSIFWVSIIFKAMHQLYNIAIWSTTYL